jgi:pyridoxamine 5'-phosphate oxidase
MNTENVSQIPDLSDPYDLFQQWFSQAVASPAIKDATAMTLATVDSDGQPWTRVVLLKDCNESGFSFFTNRTSIKGDHLSNSLKVSLNFYWPAIDKQIRIMGTAALAPEAQSDAYFAKRPRGSQIGAWASKQSTELSSRDEMIARFEKYTARFEGQDVPRPDFWGGFVVAPNIIEFWQARDDRMHDRCMYILTPNGDWIKKGLYP